jgi:hypothetical protein
MQKAIEVGYQPSDSHTDCDVTATFLIARAKRLISTRGLQGTATTTTLKIPNFGVAATA